MVSSFQSFLLLLAVLLAVLPATAIAAFPRSPLDPSAAFNQLLQRTFGSDKTTYLNPAMTAADVIANITFVPTQWTHGSNVSPPGTNLTPKEWRGPIRQNSAINNNSFVQYQCATPRTLTIYASTVSDAAYGLHHYMRRYLNSSIAWGVAGTGYNIVIPADGLAAMCGASQKKQKRESRKERIGGGHALRVTSDEDGSVFIESLGSYRYYYNVCTFGYTSAFWNWEDRWEQEIDWMAFHGLNLVLMSLPTEHLWIQTYAQFGINASQATAYFTGPAFLPWNRMGNIHSWSGPASPAFFQQQYVLGQRAVERMRDLGINPILPAFDGHVADAFVAKYQSQYPNDFTRGSDWGGGGPTYSMNYILLPSSPLFKEVGVAYLRQVVAGFGLNTYYAADTWNEMDPPNTDHAYLKTCASAIIDSIRVVDPNGIWLMQGWTFYNDRGWWSNDRIQAYLSGAPIGQLIILDLTSDNNPVYPWTGGYYGHWFIWNMLHNYGGKRGIYGAMEVVATTPYKTITSGLYPSMVGVGATPEGSETNPVLYELLFDSAWGVLSTGQQLRYEWQPMFWNARYGSHITAFDPQVLYLANPMITPRGAYAYIPPCCSHFVSFENRPFVTYDSFQSSPLTTNTAYNPDTVTSALYLLLKPLAKMTQQDWDDASALPGIRTYRYDLVDYLRQVIGNIVTDAHFGGLSRYLDAQFPPGSNASAAQVNAKVAQLQAGFVEAMQDVDDLVGCDDNYMFGRWLQEAKNISPSGEESLFLTNAIRQVSLWGLIGGSIHDYAAKQWSGLISSFYIPRWQLFFSYIAETINENNGQWWMPAEDEWDALSTQEIEEPITTTLQHKDFPVTPTTDMKSAYGLITGLADKYLPDWRGDESWQDEYIVYTNVTAQGMGQLYQSWTSLAVMQHSVCKLLPECVGFMPTTTGYGGIIYAFTTPQLVPGINTVYIKKSKAQKKKQHL